MEITTISELIDKLITINIKLYNVLDKSAELDKKPIKDNGVLNEISALSGENIRLVKNRSALKTAIDSKINEAIKNGKIDILDEVKRYGS
jgi:flagellar basal body-associated protein FliL